MSCKFLILRGDASVFDAVFDSGASSIGFDLEDTVAEKDKPAAREAVADFLRRGHARKCQVAVRISPLSTIDGLRDLLFLRDLQERPDGITLTKVESAEELKLLDKLIDGPCADVPLTAILETPLAIRRASEIAGASSRLRALSFGGKDYATAMGMQRTWDAFVGARHAVLVAAKSYGLKVFDEPYPNRDDLEGLAKECLRLREIGFDGKSAVDTRHVEVINRAFRRSEPH